METLFTATPEQEDELGRRDDGPHLSPTDFPMTAGEFGADAVRIDHQNARTSTAHLVDETREHEWGSDLRDDSRNDRDEPRARQGRMHQRKNQDRWREPNHEDADAESPARPPAIPVGADC